MLYLRRRAADFLEYVLPSSLLVRNADSMARSSQDARIVEELPQRVFGGEMSEPAALVRIKESTGLEADGRVAEHAWARKKNRMKSL